MGKKKGHNWKARNSGNFEIDNSSTKKISLEIAHRKDEFDDCNTLALPSAKRKTKNKDKPSTPQRLLSKKKRKQLEKIIEKKKKKKDRAELVEALSQTKIPNEELKQYVSLSAVQTKGLKRHYRETVLQSNVTEVSHLSQKDEYIEPVINALKGAKKQRLALLSQDKIQNDVEDLNTIGIEESSDSEDELDIKKVESGDEEQNELSDDIKKLKDSQEIAEVIEDTENGESNIHKNKLVGGEKLDSLDKICNDAKTEDCIIIKDDTKKSPLGPQKPVQVTKEIEKKPAVFVSLNRNSEIQEARLKLPILAEEQSVVEAINENSVVIITGETGSGKTTQVPQFLYEAGYTQNNMIGITEPRRVAAISMSKRVAEEMNLSEKEVSYLIRYEGNANPETKIKFMTDGVLLKEIQNDPLLKKYSVIILDEAHERSVYTDILIGWLSRIILLRAKKNESPLKLIIMSATLRVDDFINNERLFKVKPPVLNIESRQFPVTVHFNRKTNEDYVKEAVRKTVKIHTQLPDGGILIFLTGQREVNSVVKQLRKAFPYREKRGAKKIEKNTQLLKSNSNSSTNVTDSDNSDDEFFAKGTKNYNKTVFEPPKLPEVNLDAYAAIPPDDGQDDLLDLEDDFVDDDEEEIIDLQGAKRMQPMWVLPLYSLLPSERQARVFLPPPEGCRLCVVATNVAETSLTIPNIKYVVDSGKCKTRLYDKVTGVTTFVVTWTSKAAANQRAGRAGRMGPGHCYRLYSSAVFNDQFEQFSEPEICRKPVDDLLLQMKVMNIDKVVNFPFPTPPGKEQLKMSEKRLCLLGALQQANPKSAIKKNKTDDFNAKVTELGKSISSFPVLPRYGKMLALSQGGLLPYTVCMVAALSVQELLIESLSADGKTQNKWAQTRRFWADVGNSFLLGDPMVLIRAVGAAEYASSKGKLTKFCEEYGLREKAMTEIRKLRQQLTNEILLGVPDLDLKIDPQMQPPSDAQAKLLRQIILSGMVDQVAHKLSKDEFKEYSDKTGINISKWKYAYKTLEMEDPVFMHSTCVLRKSGKEAPEWVVYQEVYETNKVYIRGITAIEPEWLPKFALSLCSLSEPMLDPPPRYDSESGNLMCHRSGTFGPAGWELPLVELVFPNDIEGIKWFARFFLEGQVFSKLKKFERHLLSKPSSLTKSWAKLVHRNEAITNLLLSKGIMSRDKLLDEWSRDPKFLLSTYQKWLPESAHAEAMLMWPPL